MGPSVEHEPGRYLAMPVGCGIDPSSDFSVVACKKASRHSFNSTVGGRLDRFAYDFDADHLEYQSRRCLSPVSNFFD